MQKPSIGRIVLYTNLGDKDGKYPPEVQAAIVTGVYKKDASKNTAEPLGIGEHDPAKVALLPANKLGDVADSTCVDLRIFYRTGEFLMKCVPWSEEPARGHWNWPARV